MPSACGGWREARSESRCQGWAAATSEGAPGGASTLKLASPSVRSVYIHLPGLPDEGWLEQRSIDDATFLMTRIRALSVLTVLFGPIVAVGCASAGPATTGSATGPSDTDRARLEALYRARTDSAFLTVHEADARFMTGMIHHHAQALVMSHLAPQNGASESIRTLTGRIINAQTDEIAVMQRWLRDRGRPVPEVDQSGHMMGGHMQMAGMLTPEQLEELAAARSQEYDRLFLTYMIQHHNGAVDMVDVLFATDGAAQDDFVFKLASDIQVDQKTEVARMQRMLDAMPARETP